jgi:hypothetical protein
MFGLHILFNVYISDANSIQYSWAFPSMMMILTPSLNFFPISLDLLLYLSSLAFFSYFRKYGSTPRKTFASSAFPHCIVSVTTDNKLVSKKSQSQLPRTYASTSRLPPNSGFVVTDEYGRVRTENCLVSLGHYPDQKANTFLVSAVTLQAEIRTQVTTNRQIRHTYVQLSA